MNPRASADKPSPTAAPHPRAPRGPRPISRLVLAAAVAITLFGGCGGGGDGSSSGGGVIQPALTGSFSPSGTGASADGVRLVGAGTGDLVTVNVAISGPTTSNDLYSFAFDLVLGDPTVARYEPGSAVFGTALGINIGQGQSVLASQSNDRVVVGVSKTGGGTGNGVGTTETPVVILKFRVLKPGSTTITLSGSVSPQNPSGVPAALDSTGALIGSVQFDASSAAIVAN